MSFSDNFDYEEAKRDIRENGGDPDFLSEYNPEKRDEYLRKMGLHPKDYGSRLEQPQKKTDWDWELRSSSKEESTTDNSCFITTACMTARGFSDDCEEMMLLRRFRDTWVMSRPGGEADIRRYYAEAPGIVRRINARMDANQIWERVYDEMILPCLERIQKGDEEGAYVLYRDWTLSLAEM